jgi:hypothetical protein
MTTYAEYYQLFVVNPYVPGFQRIYHGIYPATNVNVGQGDSSGDLRVRACNGSGCGDLSNTVTAHYFNGCL